MTTDKCQYCGSLFAHGFRHCPECGAPYPKVPDPNPPAIAYSWVGLGVASTAEVYTSVLLACQYCLTRFSAVSNKPFTNGNVTCPNCGNGVTI